MNGSLSPVGNDIIWLAHFRSPGIRDKTRLEMKSYYVITRETLAYKSICDHLTRMATVDEIINTNAPKAPLKAKN